ncbi:FMN-binding protein [Pontiella sp.]|uniref:FMN-binding protein n=1 Tax=Pontiella sp. TaxID=2837462 RepID=UPI003565F1A7
MKRYCAKKSFISTFVTALSVWLGGAVLCMGSGNDSALQKHFNKVFPEATQMSFLLPKKNSPRSVRTLEVRKGKDLLGYGVEVEVVSRSGPFLVMVAVLPDETVSDVQIPKYPHKRGRAVLKRSFLAQFRGVSYGTPLILGKQVDGVSGATSSASAVTEGIRLALLLVHQCVGASAEMEK